MTKPYYVEGQRPVLNSARIYETVIGGIIISIMTGGITFLVMSNAADEVFTAKLESIMKSVDELKVELIKNFRSDSEFQIKVTRQIAEIKTEVKNLKESQNANDNN